MIFRSRRGRKGDGTQAETPANGTNGGAGAVGQIRARIEELSADNRSRRDPALERELLRLRHHAGIGMVAAPEHGTDFVEPDFEALPDGDPLPELNPGALNPAVLRAGILTHGCVLVRNLVPGKEALALARLIEDSFGARDALEAGGEAREGLYEPFEPEPQFAYLEERPWIKEGGGVWGVDSPGPMFDVLESFERAGLPGLISGYLGEPAAMSVQKVTLRKTEPTSGGEWHQDGAFMGAVRSLNVWISLTHCGDEAPGMDIVPRRIDQIVPSGPDNGALFDWSVGQAMAEEVAGDRPIMRPVFEPGDVLFFDDLFLHRTAAEKSMPNTRYAIESWFFAPSSFPPGFVPLSL
ncbi:MAG: hypothetical protein EXQ70_11225 [Solirubrobacterales bacterium]|nr:hypothetical protein [Solirubrobacterales bacterium]